MSDKLNYSNVFSGNKFVNKILMENMPFRRFQILEADTILARVTINSYDNIRVEQYFDNPLLRFFKSESISLLELNNFIISRTVPESRLEETYRILNLEKNNLFHLIKHTRGQLFEDLIWLKFDDEEVCYDDISIRNIEDK